MEFARDRQFGALRRLKRHPRDVNRLEPVLLAPDSSFLKTPAPFVRELINDIQKQLHQLDRQQGTSLSSASASYRHQRFEIFHSALKTFGEAFSSHRLLLDAIAEEHSSYVAFLREQSEHVAADRIQFASESEKCRILFEQEVSAWELQRTDALDALRRDRCDFDAMKKAHLEQMIREKASLPDSNRRVQDLQARVSLLTKENDALSAEVNRLSRLSENLSVETFSDALQSTMEELRETKDGLAEKDELLADAVDTVEDLSRDLRKLCETFIRELRRPPSKAEVRLTQRGQNALRNLIPDLCTL